MRKEQGRRQRGRRPTACARGSHGVLPRKTEKTKISTYNCRQELRRIERMHVFANPGRRRLARVLVLAGFVLSLCGCGPSPEERLARGQQAYADGEFQAAAIDARTVLQSDPRNVEARLLLGKAALETGDLDSADKELRRAVELGTEKSAVATDLGRLMLARGEFRRLLDELGPDLDADPGGTRSVLLMRAEAQLGLGDAEAARDVYRRLLADDETDTAAMLGIVSSYLSEERYEQARATLDEVLAIDDGSVPAWLRSGAMSLATGESERAEREFERAEELARKASAAVGEAEALRGLVEARLARADEAGASAALARLDAVAPGDLRTRYLKGRMAYVRQDWAAAQDHLQAVLSAMPEFRPAQMLLGAVQLNRGNLAQADMYLSAVVEAAPGNAEARRLLAETRIQQNKADEASTLLAPLLGEGGQDDRSLGMAARASIAAGDYEAATGLLERRLAQDPGNASLKLDLAAAYLAAGRIEEARELLADGGGNPDEFRRAVLGVLSFAQGGDFESAIAAARKLVEEHPADSRLRNLLGGLYLAVGESSAAELHFRRVAQEAPDNRLARVYLGRIESARGNYPDARAHFESILERNPEDTEILTALGIAATAAGNDDEAVEWLERARASSSTSVAPRVLLARRHVAREDFSEAEAVAREAVAIDDGSADAHAALGAALEASGDMPAALESYREAASLDRDRPAYALNLARAQLKAGARDEATGTLSSVGYSERRDLPSSLQLAILTAGAGDSGTAMEIGEDLVRRFPDSELPHILLGELMMREGRHADGAAQFDRALDKRMSLRIAGRAFSYRKRHDITPVARPLERFLEQEPGNPTARLALAQHLQDEGSSQAAADAYLAVLQGDPDNFMALNNLAWLYFTLGDGRAEELARRAYEIAPDNGSVADTLGWILVNNGAVDEGLELLRRADELTNGQSAAIRYHLAAALVESGQRDDARNVLTQLLSKEDRFDEREDAEALLKRL